MSRLPGDDDSRRSSPAPSRLLPTGSPAAGRYLRQLREGLQLSRSQVSDFADISEIYLGQIERGERVPGGGVMRELISSYQITPAQARYVRDLLMPHRPLPYPAGLRRQVEQTPALIEHLADLEARGVIGAFLDPIGNILALNRPMTTAFPELDAIGNTYRWWFAGVARQIIVDWATETDLVVASLKAATARYRYAPETTDLIRDLSRDAPAFFLQPWLHSTRVAYARPTQEPLTLRHPTGPDYSVIVQYSEESDSGHILRCTLVPLRNSDRHDADPANTPIHR